MDLPQCHGSARWLFDEFNVIDTGDHNRIAETARSFGAKVFDRASIDDYAVARNAALARDWRLRLLTRRR
jgi:hypothetical protein